MKIVTVLFCLFLSLNSFGQTKQETIDWLNDKFGGSQTSIYTSDVISYARILKIKDDGSFLITQFETWHNNNGTVSNYTSTFSGQFKNLTSNSFRFKKYENKGKVSFSSTSNTFLYLTCKSGIFIKQIDYKEGTKPDQNQIENISSNVNEICIGIIPSSADQSLIERSKKAFIHLITLCGGKKEAF